MISEHQFYCFLRLVSHNIFSISLFFNSLLSFLIILFLWWNAWLDAWLSVSEDIFFNWINFGIIKGLLFESWRNVKGAVKVDNRFLSFHSVGMERVILKLNVHICFQYIVVVVVFEAQKVNFASFVDRTLLWYLFILQHSRYIAVLHSAHYHQWINYIIPDIQLRYTALSTNVRPFVIVLDYCRTKKRSLICIFMK